MISNVRSKGESIRRFILENVERHNGDIAALAAAKFEITRQAVNKHLLRLREQGALLKEGNTRSPKYRLAPLATKASPASSSLRRFFGRAITKAAA